MEWIQVSILTTNQGIEPVTARLYELNVPGVEIEDETEFNEHIEATKAFWDYIEDELVEKMKGDTRVKIYLTNTPSGHETLISVRESMNQLKRMDEKGEYGKLEIELVNMCEEDWANNWRQYFKPLKIGERVLVKPVWETVEDTEGRVVFEIEPGMVFGTGTHESTRLCIEAAQRYVKAHDMVLDLGCGSGILSIIALLLGADYAVGVDIDPNAEHIAYHNAALNNIGKDRYAVLSGNVLDDHHLVDDISDYRYDVIFVNIVADVIIALAPLVAKLIVPGGYILAAGIISDRKDEVIGALEEQGLTILEVNRVNDWVGLVVQGVSK